MKVQRLTQPNSQVFHKNYSDYIFRPTSMYWNLKFKEMRADPRARSFVIVRGVNPGVWGSRSPDFGQGVVGLQGVVKYYYTLSCRGRIRSKLVTFEEK